MQTSRLLSQLSANCTHVASLKKFSFLSAPCSWQHTSASSSSQSSHSEQGSASASVGAEDTTHFGFKTVPKEQKAAMVGEVFRNVAKKYDVMNDFMSAGVHRIWKDEFVSTLSPPAGSAVLDVAGGTGDIAFRIIENFRKQHSRLEIGQAHPVSSVIVCDINPAMLEVGKERATERGYDALMDQEGIELMWQEGNAECLPFESDSFDAYTIAFGIRNVTNVPQALREAYRVLRKGGRFMCLEFSKVENPILAAAYDAYSFNVIPQLGQLVANDRDSYQYLVESIRKFPAQRDFARMIREAGFKSVSYRNMTFGSVAIHSGFKL